MTSLTGTERQNATQYLERIQDAAPQNGLFGRICGDVFCMAPPIVTEESQIDRMVEILRAAVHKVLGSERIND